MDCMADSYGLFINRDIWICHIFANINYDLFLRILDHINDINIYTCIFRLYSKHLYIKIFDLT